MYYNNQDNFQLLKKIWVKPFIRIFKIN